MRGNKLNVGIVSISMPDFVKDDIYYKNLCSQLNDLCAQNDVKLIVFDGQVTTEDMAEQSCIFFKKNDVDIVFLLNSSFASGNVIIPFVKLGLPLCLWSLPEPEISGSLPLNSFCGMNTLSSIAGVYLRDFNVRFKWFFGTPDDNRFKKRFLITIKSQKVIKTLRNTTIGLIGGVASGFNDLYLDERNLFKNLGVRLNKDITVEDVLDGIKNYDKSGVQKGINSFLKNARSVNVSDSEVERAASVYMSLKHFAESENLIAIAVSCWPKFQSEYGIAACASIGKLLDDGIVASCEGDVIGALSMLILKLLSNSNPTILDLVSFDERDDSIQMWHCGPSPSELSEDGLFDLNPHHQITYADDSSSKMGSVRDMNFKQSKATFFRIDAECQRYFTFESQAMVGKAVYSGSSGWFGSLMVRNEELHVDDLIETLIFHRLQHHYPMSLGSLSEYIYEIGAWLGLTSFDVVRYVDYLK